MTRAIYTIFVATGLLARHALAQSSAPDPPSPEPVTAKPQGVIPGEAGSTIDKRAYGVLPNYRTAEEDAPYAPITTKQKFTIARKDTFDWPSYILAAGFAGISQLDNSNPSYKQGAEGYAKRYLASIADQDIGNFMTEAVMPTLFHQDPRYFRKGHGSVGGRILYAASRVVVGRGDSGNWQFNASEFIGNGSVAALGNLYYPDAKGFDATMQRMFTQIGTDAVSQVMKEFWPDVKHHFSHKGSASAQPGD
jgi:hypothetical protein